MEAPLVSDIPMWDACFITSTSRFIMNINTVRVRKCVFGLRLQQDGIVLKEFNPDDKTVRALLNALEDELMVEYVVIVLNLLIDAKMLFSMFVI